MLNRYGRFRVRVIDLETGKLVTVSNFAVREFAIRCQQYWEYEVGLIAFIQELGGWA